MHLFPLFRPMCHITAPSPQGFGWDACEKGGWWKQLKDKIPDVASSGGVAQLAATTQRVSGPQVCAAVGQANTVKQRWLPPHAQLD